ncbi:carboxypeptidase S [Lentinula edodes]|uniref:Carboxypeptidase S n=1 Tax=Lentinula lateritia TaxID=40482 RepID=A0A9W9DPX8_9AGAR|nr:carboxypeptidase S [Lentinula edodes]
MKPISYRSTFSLFCASLVLLSLWINAEKILGLRIVPVSQYNTLVTVLLLSLQTSDPDSTLCPQVEPLFPTSHAELSKRLDTIYFSETFKSSSYQLLGAAVQIPTESYDDLLPVGQDDRWDVFKTFHIYLESAFPLIYSTLKVTTVNTYGLVLHWPGSDVTLKPLLLTAHQDVVPVDWSNEDMWVHPPYSGSYDGTWIWGRGSVDDKADLIAQLITVNSLLEAGFQPRRTIVLAFGFDEEASGTEGAEKLATFLGERYGKNAFAMILDEGEGYTENVKEGTIFALPGVSEKGYFDVSIEILAPGGHSSIPPEHTSIGLLSLLIVSLEAHPHLPRLTRNGTAFAAAKCAVEHAPEGKFPPSMKDLARRAMNAHDENALEIFSKALFSSVPFFGVLSHTTQAVDLIRGGIKTNMLPERAGAVVNHRIAEHSSTLEVKNHIKDLVLPFATRYNLSVQAFREDIQCGHQISRLGKIVLSDAFYSALEPSPITPIADNHLYDVLSGTIKSTLQSSSRYEADGVVVSPSLGLGNTDTRFYWNLTENIFRYSHRGDRDDVYNGMHTINEALRGDAFIEEIRFFTMLILNVDESH